jgi:hypothetical protein
VILEIVRNVEQTPTQKIQMRLTQVGRRALGNFIPMGSLVLFHHQNLSLWQITEILWMQAVKLAHETLSTSISTRRRQAF